MIQNDILYIGWFGQTWMVETNGPNHREFFGATLNSKEESDNLKFKYGSNQKVVLV